MSSAGSELLDRGTTQELDDIDEFVQFEQLHLDDDATSTIAPPLRDEADEVQRPSTTAEMYASPPADRVPPGRPVLPRGESAVVREYYESEVYQYVHDFIEELVMKHPVANRDAARRSYEEDLFVYFLSKFMNTETFTGSNPNIALAVNDFFILHPEYNNAAPIRLQLFRSDIVNIYTYAQMCEEYGISKRMNEEDLHEIIDECVQNMIVRYSNRLFD
jgi:hypothetical protein